MDLFFSRCYTSLVYVFFITKMCSIDHWILMSLPCTDAREKKKADKSTTHFFQCTLNISNMCTIKLLYLEEGCLLLEYILL